MDGVTEIMNRVRAGEHTGQAKTDIERLVQILKEAVEERRKAGGEFLSELARAQAPYDCKAGTTVGWERCGKCVTCERDRLRAQLKEQK